MDRRALVSGCAAGFAFSANYTNHAPMLAALRADFAFDQTRAGLLTTGLFLTHALMQIPGGRLADRFGPTRIMTAALAWVALANFALAFSGSYWHLLFWKTAAGIGSGACFTAGARYIVGLFQGRALHLAQGLYGGSIVLGSGFVLFAVPRLLGAFGWRGAFVACALLAAAVWLLWMLAVPRSRHSPPPAAGLASLLGSGRLWLLGWIQMATFGLAIVVGTWITALLRSTFHMTLASAGLIGSLVLLMGIFSRPLGGWLAQFISLGPLVASSLILNALSCAALAVSHSLPLTLAAIAGLGAGCGLPYSSVFNRAAALFPGRAGAAMGLVNMIGIVMILAGAPAVGYLADLSGSFLSGFYALAAFTLLAALASAAAQRP